MNTKFHRYMDSIGDNFKDINPKAKLLLGDCHKIISDVDYRNEFRIENNSVDLSYWDPPFNSKQPYNIIYGDDETQRIAYVDTWKYNKNTEYEYNLIINEGSIGIANTIEGLFKMLGKSSDMAYLVYIATRLIDTHRVMKDGASIFLHCDEEESHRLRCLLDGVFGSENFANKIIWEYTKVGGTKNKFMKSHDEIFRYTKGKKKGTFNMDSVREPYSSAIMKNLKRDNGGYYYTRGLGSDKNIKRIKKTYIHPRGRVPGDVWHIPYTIPVGERTGYPTQKPEELLRRIIEVGSNPGDLILDPFCGSGTSIIVAEKLGRVGIGIDITSAAMIITRNRLKKYNPSFGLMPIYGLPETFKDMEVIFEKILEYGPKEQKRLRDEFQWQLMDALGCRPKGEPMRLGSDGGFDGIRKFKLPYDEVLTVLYEVKSGKTNITGPIINSFSTVMRQNGAKMGVMVSRLPIGEKIKDIAGEMGIYKQPGLEGAIFPRIQLFELEELMDCKNRKVELPVLLPRLEDVTWNVKSQVKKSKSKKVADETPVELMDSELAKFF